MNDFDKRFKKNQDNFDRDFKRLQIMAIVTWLSILGFIIWLVVTLLKFWGIV